MLQRKGSAGDWGKSRGKHIRLDPAPSDTGLKVPAPDTNEHLYVEDGKPLDHTHQCLVPGWLPPPDRWQTPITLRAVITGVILVFVTSVIMLKGMLTIGLSPALSVPSGLLGYCLLKAYTALLSKAGILRQPFTAQENVVVQTCGVAGGALASFIQTLLSLDTRSYQVLGPTTPGNSDQLLQDPTAHYVYPLIFLIGFMGNGLLIAFRKVFIVDFRLPFPSSTATGQLINSFHNTAGASTAKRQVRSLLEWFSTAFLINLFFWCFQGRGGGSSSGGGKSCGFMNFPTFGEQALENTWQFNFQLVFVGTGMLCPHLIPWSMMVGAIVSNGIMWPLLKAKAGEWYPVLPASDKYSFAGLYAYKVFIAMALWVGDGVYNLCKICWVAYREYKFAKERQYQREADIDSDQFEQDQKYGLQLPETLEERRMRVHYFARDRVPWWFGIALYVALVILACGCIPQIWPQVKWYYILVVCIITPPCAMANAFGTALTDQNYASTYAKIAIFAFGAWAGSNGAGQVAGIVVGATVWCIGYAAAEMLQDFRTGFLTLTSSRSMVSAQLLGSLIGCIVAPAVFLLFWQAFPLGQPGSVFPAPYAVIYRGIASIGVAGIGNLPDNCLLICLGTFLFGIIMDAIRDLAPRHWRQWIPIPTAMAIPFYLGAYVAVDFCTGSVARFLWSLKDPAGSLLMTPAVATGLIAGDGLWTVPAAILALAGVTPPMCMSFSTSSAAVSSAAG